MQDYSQSGEQATILAHCGGAGMFLDIGANDGVTFSNTRALVELGWAGVYVEPGSAALTKLTENIPDARAWRRNVRGWLRYIQVAVSDKDGVADFHESDADSRFMLSSLATEQTRKWGCYDFATVTVETVTVETLLKRADLSRVDFLSIDAEGSDLVIFRQFNLSALGVRVCCVEHNGSDLAPFDTHAAAHGMRRIFNNAANCIYVKL
jgi:FkbM family methyltransferase